MRTRPFGKTGLDITVIGIGTWAMSGGGHIYGWGAQDDAESIAAIERAVDRGINWVDTAPAYGLGHSEEVVGRALKQLGSRRPLVFTKCSLVWEDGQREVHHSLEAASIRREVENSLRRLGVDAIDLMQIHWPRFSNQPTAGRLEEGWAELASLKKAGKLRHIGVSNFKTDDIDHAASVAPVETLQPPYSILRRAIEMETLPYCRARQIGVIVYSPMQAGLLSGKMTVERVAALPPVVGIQGAAAVEEPGYRGNAADDRSAAREGAGRSGGRLGSRESGGDRGHRGIPPAAAGGPDRRRRRPSAHRCRRA
jgi:aryl-alcohol dehydrogenase-like predicted oxidoreductase